MAEFSEYTMWFNMGGRFCGDTPIYSIRFHSNPLDIQSTVHIIYSLSWLYLAPLTSYCRSLTPISSSSQPLAVRWRIHRRRLSSLSIPEKCFNMCFLQTFLFPVAFMLSWLAKTLWCRSRKNKFTLEYLNWKVLFCIFFTKLLEAEMS